MFGSVSSNDCLLLRRDLRIGTVPREFPCRELEGSETDLTASFACLIAAGVKDSERGPFGVGREVTGVK